MKSNFYLKHSIMALHDPRMMQLLEISSAYIKRIVFDYQLFDIYENDNISPAELNPSRKAELKPTKFRLEDAISDVEQNCETKKTEEEKPFSTTKNNAKPSSFYVKNRSKNDGANSFFDAKMNENRKKTLEQSFLATHEQRANSLILNDLRKTKTGIKENIRDIKTTTTTKEKEKSAAVVVGEKTVVFADDAITETFAEPPCLGENDFVFAADAIRKLSVGILNPTNKTGKCHRRTRQMPQQKAANGWDYASPAVAFGQQNNGKWIAEVGHLPDKQHSFYPKQNQQSACRMNRVRSIIGLLLMLPLGLLASDFATQTVAESDASLQTEAFCGKLQQTPNMQNKQHQETKYGIINLSVANMREKADFSSEMTTQSLLGMPVHLLQHDDWYRIQTPDNYTGWVHRVAVCPVSEAEYHNWNMAEKIVVTSHYGFVYSEPNQKSQTISDVVAGNRLRWEGSKGSFYKVAYPDGRIGYISKTVSMPESRWRMTLKQDAESIVATARTMMGIPYLWAGTSSKGVDCSGYVRTVLFMHDIVMPRDASQQARVGERLKIASDFGNLQLGDLIFFGRKATPESKERVVHVGIYIGNKRFIHSQGNVRISSFDVDDEFFDEFNLNRLLFATRMLPYINKVEEINTTATNPFYK